MMMAVTFESLREIHVERIPHQHHSSWHLWK